MAVWDVLNSVSGVCMKDIILPEGRWRIEFHESEESAFFTKMVEGKVNLKGTVLRVLPGVFSHSVNQFWDQLEK